MQRENLVGKWRVLLERKIRRPCARRIDIRYNGPLGGRMEVSCSRRRNNDAINRASSFPREDSRKVKLSTTLAGTSERERESLSEKGVCLEGNDRERGKCKSRTTV